MFWAVLNEKKGDEVLMNLFQHCKGIKGNERESN